MVPPRLGERGGSRHRRRRVRDPGTERKTQVSEESKIGNGTGAVSGSQSDGNVAVADMVSESAICHRQSDGVYAVIESGGGRTVVARCDDRDPGLEESGSVSSCAHPRLQLEVANPLGGVVAV